MGPIGLIDTHCHLDYDYAPKSDADLVKEAGEAGVNFLVTIGTEPSRIENIARISERHPNVFHTVGTHPHDAAKLTDSEIEMMEKAAAHPKCRAIGEIGLDYHYDNSPREIQLKRFKEQLELALRTRLPVVIHGRDAEEDLLSALTDYSSRCSLGDRPVGVLHCYTGTRTFAEACIKLGFLVSFSGILTFKNAEDLRATATALPLASLMVETDSPFLAPIPMRGKKCEPAMVVHTARKLAELKGLAVDEIARVTTANAKRLFAIQD